MIFLTHRQTYGQTDGEGINKKMPPGPERGGGHNYRLLRQLGKSFLLKINFFISQPSIFCGYSMRLFF